MRFSTVIFDFDLTLADSSKPILTCFETALAEFGYPPKPRDEIFATIGLDLSDGLRVLSGEKDEEIIEKMRKRYVEVADEVMVKGTEFYDGALGLLRALRNKGVKYGIVSSKFRYRVKGSFELYECMELLPDVIIGRDDVLIPKPDITGIMTAIDRLGADTQSTLYVGDSYIDAMTAKNASVPFAAVLTGSTTREMFSEYDCVAVCESIKELADIIINNL